MARTFFAVVGGYMLFALLLMVGFGALYLAFGADGAFKPGSFDVSLRWALASIAVGSVAALAGGYACAAIGKRFRPALYLAVLMVVIGVGSAYPALTAERGAPEVRSGELTSQEAAEKARRPMWDLIGTPVIGAVFVLLGAQLRKPS